MSDVLSGESLMTNGEAMAREIFIGGSENGLGLYLGKIKGV